MDVPVRERVSVDAVALRGPAWILVEITCDADLRLANLAIMRKPDVLLFIMGIAAAAAFRCGPGHFTMCRGTSASLRMTQQDPTETIEVADAGGAAMNLQRRLGAKKEASIYPQVITVCLPLCILGTIKRGLGLRWHSWTKNPSST